MKPGEYVPDIDSRLLVNPVVGSCSDGRWFTRLKLSVYSSLTPIEGRNSKVLTGRASDGGGNGVTIVGAEGIVGDGGARSSGMVNSGGVRGSMSDWRRKQKLADRAGTHRDCRETGHWPELAARPMLQAPTNTEDSRSARSLLAPPPACDRVDDDLSAARLRGRDRDVGGCASHRDRNDDEPSLPSGALSRLRGVRR